MFIFVQQITSSERSELDCEDTGDKRTRMMKTGQKEPLPILSNMSETALLHALSTNSFSAGRYLIVCVLWLWLCCVVLCCVVL